MHAFCGIRVFGSSDRGTVWCFCWTGKFEKTRALPSCILDVNNYQYPTNSRSTSHGRIIKIHNLVVAHFSPFPVTRKNPSPECPLSVDLPHRRQLLPTSGPVGVLHPCMNKRFPSYKWSSNRRRSSLLLANHLCNMCMMLCSLLVGKCARGRVDLPHWSEREGRSESGLFQARGHTFWPWIPGFFLSPFCQTVLALHSACRLTSIRSALGCSQA